MHPGIRTRQIGVAACATNLCIMKLLNAKQVRFAKVAQAPVTSQKRARATRRHERTKAIAAPERLQEEQQGTIRLLDLDNAEQARLEQTDAFKELVALNKTKQSVNRPQKAGLAAYARKRMAIKS